MHVSTSSYQKFINFALDETKRRTQLSPSPLQHKYNSLVAMDEKTELRMLSFQAPKIRLLRSLTIQGNEMMQVLDFGVLPRLEFDLPIFCANFFSTPSISIIVLDLNPLQDVINQMDYKDKYYRNIMHLGVKHSELLPWGGKLTSESLMFFSPIVIWSKFSPTDEKHNALYSAFVDYYMAWLDLMDEVEENNDPSQIIINREAQHRYLTWRSEKDPGHALMRKLVGEDLAKDLIRNFLFNGLDELGSRTFLDYFPEYRCDDGSVNNKRSMLGKSFESRPWNERGEFVGNNK